MGIVKGIEDFKILFIFLKKFWPSIPILIALITLALKILERKFKPDLFYSCELKRIVIPKHLNPKPYMKFIKDKNIANSVFSIWLRNKGNKVIKQIDIFLKINGRILNVKTDPSIKENPICANLSKINFNVNKRKRVILTEFLPKKKIHILIQYITTSNYSDEKIEVIYDEKLGRRVKNIFTVRERCFSKINNLFSLFS